MKKNLIIGGLIVWNLILMAVLVFVWASSRRAREAPTMPPASAASETGAGSSEENFTYKTGDRMVGDKAPPIVDRHLTITAAFDTQGKDGVIVAHGGLAQGYVLYVQDGQLLFAMRRNNALTTVDGGQVAAGRHLLKATISKGGELGVSLDGKPPATGQAGGGIVAEPIDGLDVGGDRGAAVGTYEVPNDFGGTIEFVAVKTAP